MNSENPEVRLSDLLLVFETAALAVGLAYIIPGMGHYQPWRAGAPLPVISELMPSWSPKVREDDREGLVAIDPTLTSDPEEATVDASDQDEEEEEEVLGELPVNPADIPFVPMEELLINPADIPFVPTDLNSAPVAQAVAEVMADIEADAAPIPVPESDLTPAHYRSGTATALVDVGHKGMAHYFRALKAAARGSGVARALHYGDSTIAADGIARTVRSRLQGRFGDAGPGFVSAGMDPRWNKRSDIESSKSGSWTTKSILLGGGSGRYGLGGIVAFAQDGASMVMRAIDGKKQPRTMKHLELWYQAGAGFGDLWAKVDDRDMANQSAAAADTSDQRISLDVPEGFSKLSYGVHGGTLPLYGVVLESGRPGATWEALGVIGVGSKSFITQNKSHLSSQMSQRHPDLVAIMIGGNEAGLPALKSGNGAGYAPYYQKAVDLLRAGAPEASCLIISPLDQGTRDEDSTAMSKPAMARMAAIQQQVAEANGCAFWSAFDAMGGSGAIVRWSRAHPPLALSDLLHLTGGGQEIIGNLLSDAIIADYNAWLASGGT